jgi:hypothetical protein
MVQNLHEPSESVELAGWQTSTIDNDAHNIYATFALPGKYNIEVPGRSAGKQCY